MADWRTYSKSAKRPADIPSNPSAIYRDSGWVSLGDWLGTGRLAPRDYRFRPFREARAFVRRLRLRSVEDWSEYCKTGKRPPDVPNSPWRTYKDAGWGGFGDWLGTRRTANQLKQFLPFRQARTFARTLGLKSAVEWKAFCKTGKRPFDIPTHPWIVYGSRGWTSFGDWLGTGNVGPRDYKFRPFHQACAFARSLGLKSSTEWVAYSKGGRRPADIPAAPWRTYEDRGWRGWANWLGTPRRRKRKSRTV